MTGSDGPGSPDARLEKILEMRALLERQNLEHQGVERAMSILSRRLRIAAELWNLKQDTEAISVFEKADAGIEELADRESFRLHLRRFEEEKAMFEKLEAEDRPYQEVALKQAAQVPNQLAELRALRDRVSASLGQNEQWDPEARQLWILAMVRRDEHSEAKEEYAELPADSRPSVLAAISGILWPDPPRETP